MLTGSYGNLFRIFDRTNGSDWLYDLSDFSSPQNPGLTADSSAPLTPKRFLSPEDPLGNCLGLTAVCVASVQSLDSFMLHTDSSSVEGGSSSSSPGSCFSDGGTNDDSRSPVARDCPTDSHSSVPRCTSEDKNSPPTGSKRRKQMLSAPSIRTNELGDNETDQNYGMRRRRRRKRRLYSGSSSNNPNDFSPTACMTSHNGLREPSGLNLSSLPASEQRIRKKLARHQLFPGACPSNESPCLPDLQQLDCQRKLLHLAWHPRETKVSAVSGNQMFLVIGCQNSAPPPSMDKSEPHGWHLGSPDDLEDEDEVDNSNLDGSLHDSAEMGRVTSSELPLNAKAPKRPRHRFRNPTASQVDEHELIPNTVPDSLSDAISVPSNAIHGSDNVLNNGVSHVGSCDSSVTQTDSCP